jgi:hypothetical protein
MALGQKGILYSVVKTLLPQLGFMRYPIKFVVMAVFAIPLLAGYAVRWIQEAATNSNRERKTLQIASVVLLGLLGTIILLEWKDPLPSDNWLMTWHSALVRAAFLILVPGTLIYLRQAAELKLQLLLRVALLLMLWMDVFSHAPNLNPQVARWVFEPGKIRAYLKLDLLPHGDEPRVMQTAVAAEKVRYTYLSKPEDDYLCRRLSLYDNCNLLDDIPKIDGFYSLYLRDMAQILGLIYGYDEKNIDLKGLKDFLGVGYINATDNSTVKALEWVSRTNYLPLVTAGQKPIFSADTNTLGYLTSLDFDPREIVFLPLEAKARVTVTNRTEPKILSAKIAAQRLNLQVAADAPALVVVAQGFYHPWHAYIDGKQTELFRANYAFQALQIPAGQHQISLIYEDNVFRLGLAISMATLGICLALWFHWRSNPVTRSPEVMAGPVAS